MHLRNSRAASLAYFGTDYCFPLYKQRKATEEEMRKVFRKNLPLEYIVKVKIIATITTQFAEPPPFRADNKKAMENHGLGYNG